MTAGAVERHRIDELSDVDTAPGALFLTLLCASYERVDGGHVQKEQLVRHAELLRKQGLILAAYGKGKTRENAENYFLNMPQTASRTSSSPWIRLAMNAASAGLASIPRR